MVPATPAFPMNTPMSALLERKGTAVHTVPPEMSVTDAVNEMNRHRIGSIVVIELGRPIGIFTERDVLQRVIGAGLDPKATKVREVMSPRLITITPQTTIEETMIVFAEKHCRHLPVIENGRMTGLISIGDISRWVADSHRAEAEHLKNYIAGGFPS
jgi:CBS domain-containing protein